MLQICFVVICTLITVVGNLVLGRLSRLGRLFDVIFGFIDK